MFGVYYPAAGTADRDCGVVLCDPLGQEQIRVHRAYLRLAERLAGSGFETLRFNYYASGDSEGDGEDADFLQWRRDVSTAIDELKNGSGVSRICLVGVRFGASLAMLTGVERDDVEALVLWDPVVNGRAYLSELDAQHRDWLVGSFARPLSGGPEETREILGFPFPDRLVGEIDRFQAASITRRPANRVLLIDTEPDRIAQSVAGVFETLGAVADHEYRPSPPVWRKANEGDEFGQGMVPAGILDSIVAWIAGEKA